MSDPLREALERIARQTDAPFVAERRVKTIRTIAREAIAIEPEYQYAAVAEWADFKGTYHSAATLDDARRHLPSLQEEFGDADVYVERRIKAGPWERVDK